MGTVTSFSLKFNSTTYISFVPKMSQINNNAAAQTAPVTYPDEQSLAEYNAEVIALRTKQLVGKTVQGTLILQGGRFWVRWNKRKCDMIYVRKTVLARVLGPEPKEGTQIRCEITSLGPDISKMICQTAWFMHPQCKDIEEVPRPQPRRYRKKPATISMARARSARFPTTALKSAFPSFEDRLISKVCDRSRFFNNKQVDKKVNWVVRK